MARAKRKPTPDKRPVEEMLAEKRAGLMAQAVEQGKRGDDLRKFFTQCLLAHALDTLSEIGPRGDLKE